jgi:hypothetical protein
MALFRKAIAFALGPCAVGVGLAAFWPREVPSVRMDRCVDSAVHAARRAFVVEPTKFEKLPKEFPDYRLVALRDSPEVRVAVRIDNPRYFQRVRETRCEAKTLSVQGNGSALLSLPESDFLADRTFDFAFRRDDNDQPPYREWEGVRVFWGAFELVNCVNRCADLERGILTWAQKDPTARCVLRDITLEREWLTC